MGYYSKAANTYVNYDLDDLVSQTIKSNEHQKIANYLEVLKMDDLPSDVVSALSAAVITYVRNNTAN
jgi:hypothetical protein